MFKTWAEFKAIVIARTLLIQMDEHGLQYKLIAYDGPQIFYCNITKANLNPGDDENGEPLPPETPSADQLDFEANYKANVNKKLGLAITSLPPSEPFANPTYRTKHNRLPAAVECPNGESKAIDYILPEDLYASGGELVVRYPKFGDSITAEVYDPNGVIPVPYRAALCEAHPCVAKYVVGQFLALHDSNSEYFKMSIDTRPLVAKISAGLALRVTYNSLSVEGAQARQVLVNYFLLKKL